MTSRTLRLSFMEFFSVLRARVSLGSVAAVNNNNGVDQIIKERSQTWTPNTYIPKWNQNWTYQQTTQQTQNTVSIRHNQCTKLPPCLHPSQLWAILMSLCSAFYLKIDSQLDTFPWLRVDKFPWSFVVCATGSATTKSTVIPTSITQGKGVDKIRRNPIRSLDFTLSASPPVAVLWPSPRWFRFQAAIPATKCVPF